ncbi:thioredoxin family protein [Clostridium botulinum]|uniref:thioredoxin family protein n=1 Tax=Clostridium botulinum TaxID=1491 RepID=UPI001E433268|nr:thioredoxin family protein [Clostridium botulinum]MCD3252363.1 thioredoxin family protein [Clostridium botulinum C/D]MCD3277973.1 thioredoxin family protein [Clostridium botulinum C/D]MCD3281512.1 thioredoxin family protein [Clostridium botulinum C/D]MCD3355899.1 thioredoxin family protein [Clostridium botulinum C/D]
MGLFNFGKKKKENSCCGGSCNTSTMGKIKSDGVYIKVLGSGCKKCNELEANVKEALKELGMITTIEHVTDFSEIAKYGVMITPALVINDKVMSYGKVLKKDEALKILKTLFK